MSNNVSDTRKTAKCSSLASLIFGTNTGSYYGHLLCVQSNSSSVKKAERPPFGVLGYHYLALHMRGYGFPHDLVVLCFSKFSFLVSSAGFGFWLPVILIVSFLISHIINSV